MLKLSLLFALITTLTVLSVCQAGGCKLNDKKLKKSIKKYSTICTSKGFQSSLGCPSTKMKMSSKQEKKCKKMEGKLAACDYSCEVTAAPTEPPTEPPTKHPTEPWTEPPTKILEPAECIERHDTGGAAYRGTESFTKSGFLCQRWDSQTPNKHDRYPERYPASGLEENYCRNPDGEPRPWCYNSERTSPRWEYCDIPTC